jgi:hypothetical protein
MKIKARFTNRQGIGISFFSVIIAHFLRHSRKKPGFPLQSFLPLCGKKGFPLLSRLHGRAAILQVFFKRNGLPPVRPAVPAQNAGNMPGIRGF